MENALEDGVKNIKLKSGVQINQQPGGDIWVSPNRKEWYNVGYIYKGTFNICPVETKITEGYFPVSRPVVVFAERLGIKTLRVEIVVDKKTSAGWYRRISYGCISMRRIQRLMSKRKIKEIHSGKAILLKPSDLEIEDDK